MGEYKKEDSYNYYQLFHLDEYMYGHHGFIAGGCFKNIFNGEKPKDIDIWFEDIVEFNTARHHFEDLIADEPERWKKAYENKNVFAVHDKLRNRTLELVKRRYGTPEEILDQFDFTIVKFAYFREVESADEEDYRAVWKVLRNEDFFTHLHLKRLVIDDDVPLPVNTFNRMIKYAKYGYLPCKNTKVKMVQKLMELDLDTGDIESSLSNSLYAGLD